MTETRRWTTDDSDRVALLVSAFMAAVLPVQTLLFAYAILGPMHYLTEIAWLRKKQFYFTGAAIPAWAYAAMAVGLAAVAFGTENFSKRDGMVWAIGILLVVSLSIWIRNRFALFAIAGLALVTALFVKTWVFFLAAIVPTLLHVAVFTWIFMVTGALRSRRAPAWRWMNPVLMPVLIVGLFFLPAHYGDPGAFWMRLENSTFLHLHQKLTADLHHAANFNATLLDDRVVAGVFRVFAFVYLFHYLNWFVKTDLLQWHKVSRKSWLVLGGIYATLMVVYAWNLAAGLMMATFFSELHVLLEFPLNWHSMRMVSGALLARREPSTPAAALARGSTAAQ